MTTFSCPNCNYPLLKAENLPVPVTNLTELRYEGPDLFPAQNEPNPPSSEPADAGEELSVNRREYGSVMEAVEEWCAAEPWAGWEPSRDLFAGFKGWARRAKGTDVTITQNRFSGMLGELGSVWERVNKGRVYSLPPQFRPESWEPLADPIGGPEVSTGNGKSTFTAPGDEPDPDRLCNSCVLPFGHEGPCGDPWSPSGPDAGSPTVPATGGEEPATVDDGNAGTGPREEPPAVVPEAARFVSALNAGADPIADAVAAAESGVMSREEGAAAAGIRPAAPRRSDTFPAHTVDCALASTMGVAPCDCGATPPVPVVGDEPVETVGDEAGNVEPSGPPAVEEPPAAVVGAAVFPAGEDAAAAALRARQAAAAVPPAADPLAAPLVPVERIPAVLAEGAAAEDARVEAAAEVSRQEFLRGGSGSWLHEPGFSAPGASPFAPGAHGEEGE